MGKATTRLLVAVDPACVACGSPSMMTMIGLTFALLLPA